MRDPSGHEVNYDPGEPPDNDEPNLIECPKCGELQEDFDGFGILFCCACRYCTHASIDGTTCGLCGATVIRSAETPAALNDA